MRTSENGADYRRFGRVQGVWCMECFGARQTCRKNGLKRSQERLETDLCWFPRKEMEGNCSQRAAEHTLSMYESFGYHIISYHIISYHIISSHLITYLAQNCQVSTSTQWWPPRDDPKAVPTPNRGSTGHNPLSVAYHWHHGTPNT